MSNFPDRRTTISKLLNFEEYPEKIARQLEDIRNGPGLVPPAILLRSQASERLNAFILEEISADTLAKWAKLVFWQPDIVPEDGSEVLTNLIFRLAHPEIHQPFDASAAVDWLERLAAHP